MNTKSVESVAECEDVGKCRKSAVPQFQVVVEIERTKKRPGQHTRLHPTYKNGGVLSIPHIYHSLSSDNIYMYTFIFVLYVTTRESEAHHTQKATSHLSG